VRLEKGVEKRVDKER